VELGGFLLNRRLLLCLVLKAKAGTALLPLWLVQHLELNRVVVTTSQLEL